MESTIVIKVKYGETLRRFNASITDGQLDLNMNGLRNKIISLFNFPFDSEVTLTYIDEDGDVVTMADEVDLDDVVRQSLNPLRMSVKLSAERCVKSQGRSSGNSTPMKSPRAQPPVHNLDGSVPDILKSVLETTLESLPRLSMELGSNSTSSKPAYAEFLESLSKICLTYVKEGATKSGPTVNTSEIPTAKEDNNISKEAREGNRKGASDSRDDVVDIGAAATNGDKFPATSPSMNPSPISQGVAGFPSTETKSSFNSKLKGKRIPIEGERIPVYYGNRSHGGINSSGNYPFTGMPYDTLPSYVHGWQYSPHVVPLKQRYNHNDGVGTVFHRGVQCDGCGIHPITGPRFKSKVKEDYDLCSVCFRDMGNDTDYIRMDQPLNYRLPSFLKPGRGGRYTHTHPKVSRGSPSKFKLNSSFIADVSIVDGTVMPPSTPFTKIWRLKNTGNVVWPYGSRLVWTEGDKFSEILSAELEIPADGCPVDTEIDIAVDFKSPELPGRYISYWRMTAPSGEEFGQRIWVLIQVDAALSESVHSFNLNMPYGVMDPQMENSEVELTVDKLSKIDDSGRSAELVEPAIDAPSYADQALNFPINDTLLVGGTKSNTTPFVASSSTSEVAAPIAASPADPIAASPAQPSNTDVNSQDEADQTLLKEQSLLKELEEMGFMQVDLNKEILRMNEYNLEQSVDTLCGVSEWDPLEELQDMGFSDTETYKMLLKKNNGSIKSVVMDLIAGEKAHQS